jgi:hypothetical protein
MVWSANCATSGAGVSVHTSGAQRGSSRSTSTECCRVHGQAHGVRVGDDVGDDLVEGGHVHLDREGVGLAGPVLPALERPRAVRAAPHRVRPHGVRRVGRTDSAGPCSCRVTARAVGAHSARLGAPSSQLTPSCCSAAAFGVERVEHAGDLQPGEHLESVRAVLGDDQLAAQRLLEHSALELGQVEGEVAGQVRAADELVLGEAAVPQGQLAEAPPAGDLVAVRGDPAAGRGEQLPARRLRRSRGPRARRSCPCRRGGRASARRPRSSGSPASMASSWVAGS